MKLLEYLEKANLSTEEFARKVGVSAAGMFHYIAGRRLPSNEMALKIQEASLGNVTLKDLRGAHAGKELRGRRARKRN